MLRKSSRGYRHVSFTEQDFNYAYDNQQRILLATFFAQYDILLIKQSETLDIRPDLHR